MPIRPLGSSGSGVFANARTDYSIAGDGTDEKTKWNTAITAVSTAGGGVLYVPRGTYTAAMINPASNVTVLIEAGTVFKLPASPSADAGVFYLGSASSTVTTYIENFALVGLGEWFIDTRDAPGGSSVGSLFRAMWITNLKGGRVENLTIRAHGSVTTGQITLTPNNAWQNNTVGGGQLPLVPTDCKFRNVKCLGANGGSGAFQVAAGRRLVFDNIREERDSGSAGTGGIPLRIESDAYAGSVLYGYVNGVTARNVAAELSEACWYVDPHTGTITNVLIDGFEAVGCKTGGWLALADSTGTLGRVEARTGYIDGTGAGNHPFTGKIEGIYTPDGYAYKMSEVVLRNIEVRNHTGVAFRYGPWTLENCVARSAAAAGAKGFTFAFVTSNYQTGTVRLIRCRAIDANGTGVTTQFTASMYSDFYMEDCEAIDTRGGSSITDRGVDVYANTASDLITARIRGLRVSSGISVSSKIVSGGVGSVLPVVFSEARPGCRVYRVGAVSASDSVLTTIPMTNTDFNDDSAFYALASNGIQVKVAGLYQVSANLHYTAAGNAGSRFVALLKGGSVVADRGGYVPSAQVTRPEVTKVLRLAANDVLTVQSYVTGGATVAIGVGASKDTGLEIARLGD